MHRTPSRSHAPPHWPPGLMYIQSQCYHASVPAKICAVIRPGIASGTLNSNSRAPVIIRPVTAASHPAHGQFGLFASKKIPPRTHIIDYIGEVHADERTDSDYDLSLYRSNDGQVNVGVDARTMGNEARFVNDYRGIRAKPNAEFLEKRSASGELHMSVWSGNEGIKKGEEIVVSYGKGWWRARSCGQASGADSQG
ncbi:hypothetical protein JAAARDRAFT_135039 [Jaapia argillacea MUCL 33604]|uniref:SET domain-containing protein n=1 Tax=Jaapia argillacea MUCL 33604 TaxID=933084 RepID=A0A067PLS0_9AGAM|nr:hypothetical protein JAAARDRAFT_135039 [Jaapia argillacea MUCL 33604]